MFESWGWLKGWEGKRTVWMSGEVLREHYKCRCPFKLISPPLLLGMNSVTAHGERAFVREINGQTPVAYPNACPKTILLPLNHHAGLWGFGEAFFLLLHPLFGFCCIRLVMF